MMSVAIATSEPQVTIVVTQRERFSYTKTSLESLYKNTIIPFKLIYVDGNSPKQVKRYLESMAKEKGFHLIRNESFLSPSQARNLSLSEIDTEYVLFVDNDVLFTPRWLENLLRSAQETGAWLVGPLYGEGKLEDNIIHMAGGLAHFEEREGRKRFVEKHYLAHQPLEKYSSQLHRRPTELIEFHCVLMRTDLFKLLGKFDEQFMSTGEHWDLCLQVRENGGEIYFEPSSRITYVPPSHLRWSDIPYYNLRWSNRWNQISLQHFRQKWGLSEEDPFLKGHYNWLMHHRQMPFKLMIRRFLPFKRGSWLFDNILVPLEKSFSKLLSQSVNQVKNSL